jgi:hypothetical protein
MTTVGPAAGWNVTAAAADSDSVKLTAMPNWPQHVNVGPIYKPTAVTLADLNNDDTLEVIAGSTDSKQYAWDFHGNALTGWPKTLPAAIQSKVAVGDLFNDGRKELVAVARDGNAYVYFSDGSGVPGWPQSANGSMGFISPTLSDIDGDESLEVIVPMTVPGQAGHVYVWKADGAVCPGWPQGMDCLAVTTASVADVDADGVIEICTASYRSLYLWDKDGNPKTGWPLLLGSGASYAQPLLYDLEDDGKLEIGFACYPSGIGEVRVYRYDGTYQPGWPQSMLAAQPYVCPVAGGVLPDTPLSIFCGGHQLGGNGFYSWDAQGSAMSGWPVAPDLLECSPAVFDLDGSYTRSAMIASNTTPGNLYAYHGDGSAIPGFPFATPDAALPNSPSVGDVDLDGKLEIALLTCDGSVSLWKAGDIEYHPWLTDWGTWFHDNWHTGWLHPAAPTGLDAQRGSPGVALTWQANPEPDVDGYNVYRTTVSGRLYRRLNRRPVESLAFHDSSALGDTTYYYTVDAVLKSGPEGRLSAEADINPTGVREDANLPANTLPVLPAIVGNVLTIPALSVMRRACYLMRRAVR